MEKLVDKYCPSNKIGFIKYIYSFFTINGMHELNVNNNQFINLLQLFLAVEKLLKEIQESIDIIKEETDPEMFN